ncbi:MAG: hypothetical protein WCF18_24745 [Chthoniobacteraceae bacterium]
MPAERGRGKPAAVPNATPRDQFAQEQPSPVTNEVSSAEGAANVPSPAQSLEKPAASAPTPPTSLKLDRPTKALHSAKPVSIEAQTLQPAAAGIVATHLDGILGAKEHRAMSDIVFHNPAKIAPAAFAEGETLSKTIHETAPGVPSTEPRGGEDTDAGSSGSGHHEQSTADPFPQFTTSEQRPTVEASKANDASPIASNTAQLIQSIERAVERMRGHGGQHLEMRLPMRDGQEVVVKLRIEQGEVKATFQTTSDDLRQALETGWSQVAQSSSERAEKVATTVVESSSSENGTGNFQQSSDQRDRARHEPLPDSPFSTPPAQAQTKTPSAPRRPTARLSPSTSLEIYA